MMKKYLIYLVIVSFLLAPLSAFSEEKTSDQASGKYAESIAKANTSKFESKSPEIAGAEAGTAGKGGASGLSPVALTGLIVSVAMVIYVAVDALSNDTSGDLPVITTTAHH